MKKILLLLIFSFLFIGAKAVNDSMRVSICHSTGPDCYGSPDYSKTIEFFDSVGNIIRTEEYSISGCDGSIHHEGYRLNVVTESQYNSDRKIVTYIRSNYNNAVLQNTSESDYTYDSLGRRITTKVFGLFPSSSGLVNYDSLAYDINGDKICSLAGRYVGSVQNLDSSFYQAWIYLLPGKLLSSRLRKFYATPPHDEFVLNEYDSLNNLIYSTDSVENKIPLTRYQYDYDSLNRITNSWYQEFDSLASSWGNQFRFYSIYDSLNRVVEIDHYQCSSQLCNDTNTRSMYSYSGNSTVQSGSLSQSFDSPSSWQNESGSYINLGANGVIIEQGEWYHVDAGCSHSSTTINSYNSNQQLIHSYQETLNCNYYSTDCEYYNLNEDSLLLQVVNFGDVCEKDTLQFAVVAEGGQAPLTYHWSPGNMVSDSTIQSPIIYPDTLNLTPFVLTVTDAGGISKSATILSIAMPAPIVSLGNDTVVCTGSQVVLDPGLYNDYLWEDNSQNRLHYISSNIPDTVLYFVNVMGQNFCWNSDSISVIYDICSEVTGANGMEKVSVFPNPADNFVNIYLSDFNYNVPVYFNLIDQLGRIVCSQKINSAKERIDLRGIFNGIYFYSITTFEKTLNRGSLVVAN